jgi:hypothetical protein
MNCQTLILILNPGPGNLDQVMHDEMTARKRITAAQKIIDAADAKRIVAESGERMAQAVAKGDKKV